MNYVKHFNMYGVSAMQIPCVTGTEAPTEVTKGAVGLLYMNTTNGDVYKCTSVTGGINKWSKLASGGGSGDGFSPIVSLTKSGKVTTLMITDAEGTETSKIYDGEDGYTPERGTDYWTENDIAEIKSYVDDAILGGAW